MNKKPLTAIFSRNTSPSIEVDDRMIQIRDLLIGSHLEKFERQLNQINKKIDDTCENLQIEMASIKVMIEDEKKSRESHEKTNQEIYEKAKTSIDQIQARTEELQNNAIGKENLVRMFTELAKRLNAEGKNEF